MVMTMTHIESVWHAVKGRKPEEKATPVLLTVTDTI